MSMYTYASDSDKHHSVNTREMYNIRVPVLHEYIITEYSVREQSVNRSSQTLNYISEIKSDV